MAQVAKRAGVHTTTVSLALRNHPSLPEATRERLRKLAEEMGYRPDPNLRALMAYRHGMQPRRQVQTLAYVTNWDARWAWKELPAHAAFFNGAEARAAALGYQLEHFWMGEPQMSDRRLGDILHARGIHGVILASHQYDKDERLDLDWSRLSAVKIDYFPHEPQLHIVTNDQHSILRQVTTKVLAAGYRRVGLVLHRDWDRGVDYAMSSGFIGEQQRLPARDRVPIHYIEKNGQPPPEAKWGGRAPVDKLAKWLDRYRPDVVLGYGPAVLPCLQELGLAVPQDLAFADILLQEPDGRVAGVRHNCLRVGELAVELLAGQLQMNTYGLPPFPTATLVEGTWFDGASLPRRVLS